MDILTIIPARSGSKGYKNKNIRELNGIPLIGHAIKVAKDSGISSVIHLSTDSEEYVQIGREYGADIPFLRDAEYASDTSSTWSVVKHVLEKYKAIGREFDAFMILQPTTPLRSAEDIIGAYEKFTSIDANAVVSVCEMDHSPIWSGTLPEDGDMSDFVDKRYRSVPRQQLPTYYRVNGAIYIVKTKWIYETDDIYSSKCYAYCMDRIRSVDIDTELDFKICETIMKESKR